MIQFWGAPCEVPRAGQLSDVPRELGAGVPVGPTSLRRALHPEQTPRTSAGHKCAKPVSVQNLYSASSPRTFRKLDIHIFAAGGTLSLSLDFLEREREVSLSVELKTLFGTAEVTAPTRLLDPSLRRRAALRPPRPTRACPAASTRERLGAQSTLSREPPHAAAASTERLRTMGIMNSNCATGDTRRRMARPAQGWLPTGMAAIVTACTLADVPS